MDPYICGVATWIVPFPNIPSRIKPKLHHHWGIQYTCTQVGDAMYLHLANPTLSTCWHNLQCMHGPLVLNHAPTTGRGDNHPFTGQFCIEKCAPNPGLAIVRLFVKIWWCVCVNIIAHYRRQINTGGPLEWVLHLHQWAAWGTWTIGRTTWEGYQGHIISGETPLGWRGERHVYWNASAMTTVWTRFSCLKLVTWVIILVDSAANYTLVICEASDRQDWVAFPSIFLLETLLLFAK